MSSESGHFLRAVYGCMNTVGWKVSCAIPSYGWLLANEIKL